ncbi:hypothetical protein ABW20_dc0108091 [Dactylellina cionopaga]|nr:hypothetical protein ABW20_dc0108091 [Dactylellina cionopaga]
MVLERTIRAQVLAIPTYETHKTFYNYGPYQQPNDLPTFIRGVPETSPLHGWNIGGKRFRLCWRGYEDPRPDWSYPHVCDVRAPGAAEAFRNGMIWIPEHSHITETDHLVTMGSFNDEDEYVYKDMGAAVQEDNTIAMTLMALGDTRDRFNLKFYETSTWKTPGSKEVGLHDISAWATFGLDDWQLEFFYVCDHPTNGRIVYLDNPYGRTNNTELWSKIPCQVITLQVRYWHDDRRPRRIRPIGQRNLANRDDEDPEIIKNNIYKTVINNIPRIIRFVDEDGEDELPWTDAELRERRSAELQGREYVRPYIQQRRAEQLAASQGVGNGGPSIHDSNFDSTIDTFGEILAGVDDEVQQPPQNADNGVVLVNLLSTVLDADDSQPQTLVSALLSEAQPALERALEPSRSLPSEAGAGDMAANHQFIRDVMSSVVNTENRLALLALAEGGMGGDIGRLSEQVRREWGLEDPRANRRINRVEELGEVGEEEEGDSDEALAQDDNNSSPSLGVKSLDVAASGPQNQNSRGGYCKKFLGKLCNNLSDKLSDLLRWSRGPPLDTESLVEEEAPTETINFREPIDFPAAPG